MKINVFTVAVKRPVVHDWRRSGTGGLIGHPAATRRHLPIGALAVHDTVFFPFGAACDVTLNWLPILWAVGRVCRVDGQDGHHPATGSLGDGQQQHGC